MGADLVDAITKESVIGDLRIKFGTYTNASGSTGGDVVTQLSEILHFETNCGTSQAATVNLIAISGGTATITCVDDEDGQWMAIGK